MRRAYRHPVAQRTTSTTWTSPPSCAGPPSRTYGASPRRRNPRPRSPRRRRPRPSNPCTRRRRRGIGAGLPRAGRAPTRGALGRSARRPYGTGARGDVGRAGPLPPGPQIPPRRLGPLGLLGRGDRGRRGSPHRVRRLRGRGPAAARRGGAAAHRPLPGPRPDAAFPGDRRLPGASSGRDPRTGLGRTVRRRDRAAGCPAAGHRRRGMARPGAAEVVRERARGPPQNDGRRGDRPSHGRRRAGLRGPRPRRPGRDRRRAVLPHRAHRDVLVGRAPATHPDRP